MGNTRRRERAEPAAPIQKRREWAPTMSKPRLFWKYAGRPANSEPTVAARALVTARVLKIDGLFMMSVLSEI
jgi:hypothetical protein